MISIGLVPPQFVFLPSFAVVVNPFQELWRRGILPTEKVVPLISEVKAAEIEDARLSEKELFLSSNVARALRGQSGHTTPTGSIAPRYSAGLLSHLYSDENVVGRFLDIVT